MYKKTLKRVLDFVIALTAVILLTPVFILIACVLMISTTGNPIFVQVRPGLDEKMFKLYKFKTMDDKVGHNGKLLPDSERLTIVGRFLRKTSLDELPQLFNVIKGDMSLVGPRPLLPRYLPFYNSEEKLRHKIRPGITGWAQINGRNASSWNDRLAADVFYYKQLSCKLDFFILFQTVKKVVSGRDIVIDPNSAMNPLDVERSAFNS